MKKIVLLLIGIFVFLIIFCQFGSFKITTKSLNNYVLQDGYFISSKIEKNREKLTNEVYILNLNILSNTKEKELNVEFDYEVKTYTFSKNELKHMFYSANKTFTFDTEKYYKIDKNYQLYSTKEKIKLKTSFEKEEYMNVDITMIQKPLNTH